MTAGRLRPSLDRDARVTNAVVDGLADAPRPSRARATPSTEIRSSNAEELSKFIPPANLNAQPPQLFKRLVHRCGGGVGFVAQSHSRAEDLHQGCVGDTLTFAHVSERVTESDRRRSMLCPMRCNQPCCLGVGSTPDHTPAIIWAPALIPASPPIKATAAEQKHDNDDDEKSCHIHDAVSFGRTVGNLISPTSRRTGCLLERGLRRLFL